MEGSIDLLRKNKADHQMDMSLEDSHNFKTRETSIRNWIARNECVCPYAPGLAKFTYLKSSDNLDISYVKYLANELNAFYQLSSEDTKTERWLLLPEANWNSHSQARKESENFFWGLLAAYYYLKKDHQKVRMAQKRKLQGYWRDKSGDIGNPIVGKLSKTKCDSVDPKALFCTALSQLYRSKKFYRYSPASVMVLVYATDFCKAQENEKAVRKINLEMACSNLRESFGEGDWDNFDLEEELGIWEEVILRTIRFQGLPENTHLTSAVLDRFRMSPDHVVDLFTQQVTEARLGANRKSDCIIEYIKRKKQVSAKEVISSHFSGAGLYSIPHYFD